MFKSILAVALTALSFGATQAFAAATVVETYEYSEIFTAIEQAKQEYANEDILLVFDIDDTLLVIDHCLKEDGTMTKGIEKMYLCPSFHTEDMLSTQIQSYQEQGLPTMALTARGRNLIRVGQRELARVHDEDRPIFDFDGKPFDEDLSRLLVPKTRRCNKGEEAPCLTGEKSRAPKFEDGVLYVSGAHKGLSLQAFFKKMKVSYPKIIFIDDRDYNTRNMRDSFKNDPNTDVEIFLYLRHRD
ncbi:MAG: DUF2608 domain-containing protein [Bdellovibrionales bacterium]|nr:DUF2608 domain-containing protein [Bdellovibrionales bacterium]